MLIEINAGYKYRLYPTLEQRKLLNHCFFVANQAYNVCLDYQKSTWDRNKDLDKKDRVYPKASEIDDVVRKALKDRDISAKSVILQQERIHASRALMDAITSDKGFPRFKNSRLSNQSFSWNNQGYSIKDTGNPKFKILRLMKQDFKVRFHRDLPEGYKLNSITISRKANKYYVSFGITYQSNVDLISSGDLDIKRAVGIDVNVDSLAYSTGTLLATNSRMFSAPKYSSAFKRLQRKNSRRLELARKEKRKVSKKFYKTLARLNKVQDKVSNSKTDLLHKIAKETINKFDAIVVEDLKVKDIAKSEGNAKKARNRVIQDASFYRLLGLLEYKSMRNGKLFIKINPQYTSMTCSHCDFIHFKLGDKRIFKCPRCNTKIHRDYNAAINILSLGLASLGLGISLQTINVKPFELVRITELQSGSLALNSYN